MGDKQDSVPSAGPSKKKREEKSSRRDPRSWENVTKHVANLSEEEKYTYISEKYVDIYNELRKVTKNYQNIEKSYAALQKEKDQLQAEQARCILAKATMESLCRELQKQNKQIKEENIAKLKEDEERRKEVAAKFTEKLNDITLKMEENKDKSWKLRDENIQMTSKLSELYEQFKEREDNLNKITKQMDLSKQLSNAQIQKLEYELTTERQLWSKEKEILQNHLQRSEANCASLEETVKSLKEHVGIYKSQYSDFETTMSKSNKIFENFKSEISKMSKRINILEKESNQWKARYQGSASSLLEISQINQSQDLELKRCDSRIDTLQKLCRQLQTDRAAYLKQLKSNGIEPIQSAIVEEAPVEASSSNAAPVKAKKYPKTQKEKELEKLKANLKVFQEQLRESIKNEEANGVGKEKTEENQSNGNVEKSKTDEENVNSQVAALDLNRDANSSKSAKVAQKPEIAETSFIINADVCTKD